MRNILILSHDDAFRAECTEALQEEGYTSYAVATEIGVEDFIQQKHGEVDLVIVNAKRTDDDEAHRVLDYVSRIKPHVSVLLSYDYFSYWNDFHAWVADRCVVRATDLRGLRDAVKDLVQRNPERLDSAESGKFAVDWS